MIWILVTIGIFIAMQYIVAICLLVGPALVEDIMIFKTKKDFLLNLIPFYWLVVGLTKGYERLK